MCDPALRGSLALGLLARLRSLRWLPAAPRQAGVGGKRRLSDDRKPALKKPGRGIHDEFAKQIAKRMVIRFFSVYIFGVMVLTY